MFLQGLIQSDHGSLLSLGEMTRIGPSIGRDQHYRGWVIEDLIHGLPCLEWTHVLLVGCYPVLSNRFLGHLDGQLALTNQLVKLAVQRILKVSVKGCRAVGFGPEIAQRIGAALTEANQMAYLVRTGLLTKHAILG